MVDAGKTRETTPPLSLADRYDLAQNRIFVSGPQAVVRLLLMQAECDRRAGRKTAGFVSGYRGSPLGGLDLNLARAKKYLEARDILFEPGLNEDLAATAVWGRNKRKCAAKDGFDGVFGLWYGKGRASIDPATCYATSILPAHRGSVASWRSWAMIIRRISTTAHQSEFTSSM